MRRAGIRWVAVVLAVAAVPACVTPHNSLGTRAGPCFRGLDEATAVVHHRGVFVGVRDVQRPTADRILGLESEVAARPAGPLHVSPRPVCLFAFRGPFGPGDVEDITTTPTAGRYAVVGVTLDRQRPVGAVVVERLPLHFRRP